MGLPYEVRGGAFVGLPGEPEFGRFTELVFGHDGRLLGVERQPREPLQRGYDCGSDLEAGQRSPEIEASPRASRGLPNRQRE